MAIAHALETIKEASSDCPSHASSTSDQAASRKQAMRKLRARGCKQTTSRSKPIRDVAFKYSSYKVHSLPKLQTARLVSHPQPVTVEDGSESTQSPAQQDKQPSPLTDPSSHAASDGDDEAPTSSASSVNLNSFPLPPTAHLDRDLTDVERPHDINHLSPNVRELQSRPPVPDSRTMTMAMLSPSVQQVSSSGLPTQAGGINRHGLPIFADGAASARNTPSVDSALVDAISRSVAEQLRMLSLSVRGSSGRASRSALSSLASAGQQSRPSSRNEALKRFTKDLGRYADYTGARGKLPHLTPSSKSPETLHTVSALLPYQGEFRAAGLAVTSKEQASKTSKAMRPTPSRGRRGSRLVGSPVRMSQVDGENELCDRTATSSTEVSFADPNNVDEWRYALIEEIPAKKTGGKAQNHSKTSWCWIPCAAEPDSSDHEHIKRSLAKVRKAAQQMAASAKGAQTGTSRPSYIPMPRTYLGSAEPSPRHLCDTGEQGGAMGRESKPTGRRRPSMTLARTTGHLPTCGQAQTYPYEEIEINKHNPRAITTQLLHPSAAVRPRASGAHLQTPAATHPRPMASRYDPPLMVGNSLPELPSSTTKHDMVPVPLRHTVGHLADPGPGKRVLVVRNPDEPSDADAPRSPPQPRGTTPNRRNRGVRHQRRKRTITPLARRPSIPVRASSLVRRDTAVSRAGSSQATADRQVLRGLHVLASAACDEEIDDFVMRRTGVHVRQLLASLVALESMWSDGRQSPERSDERARHRRAQMRTLKQQMRCSRQAISARPVNSKA